MGTVIMIISGSGEDGEELKTFSRNFDVSNEAFLQNFGDEQKISKEETLRRGFQDLGIAPSYAVSF